MKIIQPPFQKPHLFIFVKQTNGEYIITINPEYLANWRSTHLAAPISNADTDIEKRAKTSLIELEQKRFEIIWTALKSKLRKLSHQDKLELLKREWDKSYLFEEEIPAKVEKHFMTELSDKKIILPE